MKRANTAASTAFKRPSVVVCSLGLWLLFLVVIIWPWIDQFDTMDMTSFLLPLMSAIIWWLGLLWALHHLCFKLAAFFRKTASQPEPARSPSQSIAILYVTCDDFNPNCCQSCIDQDYPSCRVLICDDSQELKYREMIREFLDKRSTKCELVTRPNNQGFKAGNLNHALKNCVNEEWVLLVDADQLLPIDFLTKLAKRLPSDDPSVAFIQAAHKPLTDPQESPFQAALSPEVTLFYSRDLSVRETFGFVPLLGHGALIRRSAWSAVGGFPERVSEDFAFALRLSSRQQHGIYVDDIESYEAYPFDFGGFMIRIRKYAGGTAETLLREAAAFFSSSASRVEKYDFGMQVSWYVLAPVMVLNSFLSAYVVHGLWIGGLIRLHPLLPYLYSRMLLFLWVVITSWLVVVSITQNWQKAWRFYFWSTAIYTSAMPLTGLSFIKHLFARPIFKRTPKNGEATRLSWVESIFMIFLGLTAVTCALTWLSPFSPVLIGQGVAYLSYTLYGRLCTRSLLGTLSRKLVYIPGLLMLVAIFTMLKWGRY
ncbi:MAG TPA: glycosyltransferase family 2 protein [Anaerolineae bacterium]|nr:glycosyltransferase family 2 protein [Anaerolineae bacterium]